MNDHTTTRRITIAFCIGLSPVAMRPGSELAQAQTCPSFAAPASFPVGSFPRAVATGDWDNDGDVDLAVTNPVSNSVSILLNQCDGNFARSDIEAVGNNVWHIIAADLDHDGDADLAAASPGTGGGYGNVRILRNVGSGQFTLDDPVNTGGGAHWIAAADFDHDTHPDLAVANFYAGTVSLLWNDGAGQFPSSTTLDPVWPYPYALDAGDLNADTWPDLIVTSEDDQKVDVFLKTNGDRTFSTATTYSVGQPGTQLVGVVLSDFDGDHILDAAIGNITSPCWGSPNPGFIHVLKGAGDGTFTPQLALPGDPTDVTAADINDDGWPDLVSASCAATGLIGYWLNDANGGFHPPVYLSGGTGKVYVRTADLDGDADQDIIAVDAQSNRVYLHYNQCITTRLPCDDFEDGIIETCAWEVGGRRYGWNGLGTGSWEWSHQEVAGCLDVRVWGPTSGNTYCGEAWAQTTFDYNDGQAHVINFTWGADVNAHHIDIYAIQVADGSIPATNDYSWYQNDGQAWKNLHYQRSQTDLAPTAWSILIDGGSDTATLYSGPNLTGQILGQKSLPSDQPWRVRFIQTDATSSGFPPGDNLLSLCDFCSELAPDCNTNGVPDFEDIAHDCCQTGHGAGCSYDPIEACVCDADRYCCLVEWDQACVDRATSGECGPCDIDCNTNGVPDECDIEGGASQDCQPDRIPDECQTAGDDCDANDVPDECQPDCDADGTINPCDADMDNDGVANEADECDNTPVGRAVDPAGRPLGDIDRDCDTDMEDYMLFLSGLTGPLATCEG